MRRLICLISVVLLLSLANIATAIDYYWQGTMSEAWTEPNNWSDSAGNPLGSYPGEDIAAERANLFYTLTSAPNFWTYLDSEINTQSTGNPDDWGNLKMGDPEGDGKLTLGPNADIAFQDIELANSLGSYAELNIYGGSVAFNDDIRIGREGHAVLNMTGGLFLSWDRGEALDMARDDAAAITEINISGGLIDVNRLGPGPGTNIIRIAQTGMFKFDEDRVAEVQALIDNGTIIQEPDDDSGGLRVYYDGATSTYLASRYSPFHPRPRDEANLLAGSAVEMTWDLPDPNRPGISTVTCDVYFGTNPVVMANPMVVDHANGAAESYDAGAIAAGVWYWQIFVYDSDNSDTVPYMSSRLFSFEATETPVVGAGEDVDTWLVGASRVVQLDGSHEGGGTLEWTVTEEPDPVSNPAMISDSTIVNPTVTITEPGSYTLQITATLGEVGDTEEMQIVLYADACKHAQDQDGFVTLSGDSDNDCDVDLADVANVAASWLMDNRSTE